MVRVKGADTKDCVPQWEISVPKARVDKIQEALDAGRDADEIFSEEVEPLEQNIIACCKALLPVLNKQEDGRVGVSLNDKVYKPLILMHGGHECPILERLPDSGGGLCWFEADIGQLPEQGSYRWPSEIAVRKFFRTEFRDLKPQKPKLEEGYSIGYVTFYKANNREFFEVDDPNKCFWIKKWHSAIPAEDIAKLRTSGEEHFGKIALREDFGRAKKWQVPLKADAYVVTPEAAKKCDLELVKVVRIVLTSEVDHILTREVENFVY